MNLKSSLLALAAVVALGTTALTSTSAEAHGKFGGGGSGVPRWRLPRWWRTSTAAASTSVTATSTVTVTGTGIPHWRQRHVHYYPRPVIYAARPVVYSAAPVVTTNRCTCLTKEYTQEGAVLFKDICTNEAAINPPPAPPVQTGYAPAVAHRRPGRAVSRRVSREVASKRSRPRPRAGVFVCEVH